ncbi:MAG: hypothetical protein EH225_13550 [Calditrichaeota bacterium]|nr:hypothetical protein [Calditrichota bacterium]RQV92327.1 MAG: hypothetical protein EH221_11720 [bacterium]RQV98270.1 MAG: hypothetical protein EH225_13550 [Calditrichota bacterium]
MAVSIDWEYDRDFVQLLEEQAHRKKINSYVIWPGNLEDVYSALEKDDLAFRFLFDRASDTSPEFHKIQKMIREKGGEVLETLEELEWAKDKATMHLEFIDKGLHTPYTIILPPYDSEEEFYLSVEDLSKLGRTFYIKPANTTGGGVGVVHGAETLHDVLTARQNYQQDKYLIQEKVIPQERDGYRFWFRGYYACGLAQCAWWNDQNHLYRELSREEIRRYRLKPLFRIVNQIAEISKLKFFSTEIALTEEGKFIVVDYVNESCDMRLQSKAVDGIPDKIVHNIVAELIKYVRGRLKNMPNR